MEKYGGMNGGVAENMIDGGMGKGAWVQRKAHEGGRRVPSLFQERIRLLRVIIPSLWC